MDTPYLKFFNNCAAFVEHYRETYCDFVYDARSGIFYVEFTEPHVEFISKLFLRNGGDQTVGTRYDHMDAFVMQGMGMFKSRAGHKVMISENFVLPDDLWPLKRDLEYV